MRTLLCALVLVTSTVLVSAVGMDTVYQWKYVDFAWESEARRKEAIASGEYDFSRLLPMDVDKAPDGRIFVSMLGMDGVPATLVTVTNKTGPSGPLVRPYPDWSYFKKGSCDSIQNVYRIAIDKCERLWVIDTGFLEGQLIKCEPQLLAFDLKTDRLIHRIKIPNDIARGQNGQTLLVTPIVQTNGWECRDTTVYISDVYGHGLIIWNNGKLSRLENPIFQPSMDAVNFTVGNHSQQMVGGIVIMDLSPEIFPGEARYLYFHSLSSFSLYAASAEALKRGSDIRYVGAKNVLSSQAVGMAFSSGGTLFLGLAKEAAIACWHRYRDLQPYNIKIVAQDSEQLQYTSGMKVIGVPGSRDEEVWAVTNRFIGFQIGQLNANDYNYRIVKGSVQKLIAGTLCEIPSPQTYSCD